MKLFELSTMQLSCCLLFAASAFSQTFPFTLPQTGEAIAILEMAAPNTNWSLAGKEAAMAQVQVDSAGPFQIMLFAGPQAFQYRVLLGELAAGPHHLKIARNAIYSSKDAELTVKSAKFEQSTGIVERHAPMLYERKSAVGLYTDIPLVLYCEQKRVEGETVLEYTVIFSNEDGGTSTRGLMARWGRTTDIEFVYRVVLNPQGTRKSAMIQGRGHNEGAFTGPFEGDHPMLMPVTQNNMVAGEGPSAVRYQPAPVVADLTAASRELVMDQHPITWRVMAEELIRENKLRPAGKVDGEKISDPRHYIFIEAKIKNQHSRTAAIVRLKGKPEFYMANLGRNDLAIERDGWMRTTVELPAGVTAEQIGEIGFQCLAADREKEAGVCQVDRVAKVFLLGRDYLPGPSIFKQATTVTIPTGQMHSWILK